MLTINEAIARFEANAEQNERWASGGLNPEANAEYAAEHRQLAAWLRELAERREAPEIVEHEKAQLSQEGTTSDLIDRQAALDIFDDYNVSVENGELEAYSRDRKRMCELPPAQPERRCVNCGRTVNNGGWYEDGRTRCPIEEHYALPKDGYCHLWEKRKDWEDDYVKRAEEGEK